MGLSPYRGPYTWHFDIDTYLNPILPPSILPSLPSYISHFLGYRTHPPRPLGNLVMVLWAAIGVFCSLAIIGAVSINIPSIQAHGTPTVLGSYGAAAVLSFYAIESPLSQPRNAILGQIISAVTGIIIHNLFSLSPHFAAIRWLGASLACACATVLMALTGTVHPPAGATALIAVLDDHVAPLGFFLLVPVCLSCGLMLCVALLVNNVQRRFPFYWWSPQETGSFWRRAKVDIERETGRPDTVDRSERRLREKKEYSGRGEQQAEEELTSSSGDLELGRRVARSVSLEHGREGEIVIRRGRVRLPDGLMLRPEELLFLETLGERLGHLGHSEKPY